MKSDLESWEKSYLYFEFRIINVSEYNFIRAQFVKSFNNDLQHV